MLRQNYILITYFISSFAFMNNAQVLESTNLIKGGVSDAEKVLKAYLSPLENGIGMNSSQSSVILFKGENTSKWKFGLSLSIEATLIKKKDRSFNFNDLNLQEFHASDPSKTTGQTISGNNQTINLESNKTYLSPSTQFPFYTDKPMLKLNSPKGIGLGVIPFTRIHFIAEKNGNLIALNLLPSFKFSQNTIGVFAIGASIQHNLETSFTALKDFPLDFYINTGYNYNRIRYFLDIKPDESELSFSNPTNDKDYENQVFQMNVTTIPIQLSVVKPVKKFSFAISTGYNIILSVADLKGNYPVYRNDPTSSFNIVVDNFSNPIHYKSNFDHFFIGLSTTYRSEYFNMSLKYNHSNSKNLSVSFMLLI